MNPNIALLIAMTIPFLAFVPYVTPPEWWFDLHDPRTRIGRSANYILNCELRLGRWETA